MDLLTYPAEDVLSKASEAVNMMLEREFGGPLLFLLSGGSSLKLLDSIRTEHLGSHMTVAMSDERYGQDATANNFSQMMATRFYDNAKGRNVTFVDTRVLGAETLSGFGERLDKALKDWRAANPKGRVVMTQGVGPDGHTCGMMPFPKDDKMFEVLFENKDKWAVGYDATGKNEFPFRMTITVPFLRNEVDESVVYAVGINKHTALKHVLKSQQKLNDVPAFVLREMKKATVFTDQHV